jgi:protein regulator of cytokinesis 1
MKVQLPPLSPNATLPPTFDLSHSYFSALDSEFTRVYDEYQKRITTVSGLSSEIITLWAELGTPQAQTDSNIVEFGRESPEQLGIHPEDLSRLKAKRDKLLEEKKGREKRLKDVRTQIEQLWDRLCISEPDQKEFLARNRGCGMRAINEFEEELGRLNELKRQNLGLFVEEARIQIQGLWDGLYFSEEEMLEFTPAFSGMFHSPIFPSSKLTWFRCL